MADLELKRLRDVRRRAEELLRYIDSDLGPFLHEKDKETFRRKPESESIEADVNVTTTCSCVMALSLSNAFRKFYSTEHDSEKTKSKSQSLFSRLVGAPWMSSGLTASNPFSTTLVLRTYGFLKKEGLLDTTSVQQKEWELHLGINDPIPIAEFLKEKSNETAHYLYSSLSDRTRRSLEASIPQDADELVQYKKKLTATLALDLQRLIQSGYIYNESRFPKAGKELKEKLAFPCPTGYKLAIVNRQLFAEQFPNWFPPPQTLPLNEIAERIAADVENFRINEYSPSTTVIYWFVDALERAGMPLEGKRWSALCKWATHEFNHERSLVLAGHDAMMDPVAMAMAACLCAKLRNLAARADLGMDKAHREMLPSLVELEHSIQELFKHQAPSGIWPKYFPLFHYQDAGSNFCFTFEMLEAVLCEFGRSESNLLDQDAFIKGLESAVSWCEENRLHCSERGIPYTGWNSGGDIDSLEKERPESWATAVVHMFLWEVVNVISQRIQKRVLEKYKARPPKLPVEKMQEAMRTDAEWKKKNFGRKLSQLQDIELYIDRNHDSLVRVLTEELLSSSFPKTESEIRREKLKGSLSALLFGPPGTSKTQITKAVAEDLGWPMIEINPSEFVKGSFANVYLQAEDIFTDLMDLAAVVILFDEMDALTQKRSASKKEAGGNQLDTATQFLTTSMLPKLTALHDKGGVVFFMATNFQENFDPAIKRAGRFDFLLCMGPPTGPEKVSKFECFFDPPPQKDQKDKATKLIGEYLTSSTRHQNIFELLTYGDCKALLKRIGNEKDIGDKLAELGSEKFLLRLDRYSETIGLRYDAIEASGEGDITLREIDLLSDQKFEERIKKVKDEATAQYLKDRRLSRRQI